MCLQVYAYYEPEEPRPELRVTAEEVLQLSQQREGVLLLDTRSAEQYTAQVRTLRWLWLSLRQMHGQCAQHDSCMMPA